MAMGGQPLPRFYNLLNCVVAHRLWCLALALRVGMVLRRAACLAGRKLAPGAPAIPAALAATAWGWPGELLFTGALMPGKLLLLSRVDHCRRCIHNCTEQDCTELALLVLLSIGFMDLLGTSC